LVDRAPGAGRAGLHQMCSQLSDNQILMGTYVADEGTTCSKGTMIFQLHPHGMNMTGRWLGLSYDGPFVTGWGAMARDESEAESLVRSQIAKGA
jgi:hypothetical protein